MLAPRSGDLLLESPVEDLDSWQLSRGIDSMNGVGSTKRGKVALVTGGAGGIGLAFSRRLAREGAALVVADIAEAPALVDELFECGAKSVDYFRVDVSDEGQVAGLAHDVLARHGRCDILVNNVGTGKSVPFVEMTLEDWRHMMAVNVDSMFMLCRAFVPSMMDRQYGRIVNVASNMLGLVIENLAHSVASKGAVIGLTRALASEMGSHGITVNCIAPGLTRTASAMSVQPEEVFHQYAQAQAIKRIEEPEDLAGAMSFLTSDDCAFMTGQTLIVDGGLLRAM
jgi:NAD(P)-dependent dehydrogenase (short-subunit alcohol dehydrogenase family)